MPASVTVPFDSRPSPHATVAVPTLLQPGVSRWPENCAPSTASMVNGAPTATVALPVAVVVAPPASLIVTETVYLPENAYVCEPATRKLPSPALTVPELLDSSPQLIVAV